jgi:hypothetical protein
LERGGRYGTDGDTRRGLRRKNKLEVMPNKSLLSVRFGIARQRGYLLAQLVFSRK